jgi:nucleoside 2-deoxyribosyltransferase
MSETKRAKGTDQRPSIFLSYSQSDAEFAKKVRKVLSCLEVRIFTHEELSAGENWQEKLKAEIKSADLVIALATPKTLDSSWVLQELGAAWALKKPIIAIGSSRSDLINRLPLKLSGLVQAEWSDLEDPAVGRRLIEEVTQFLGALDVQLS